MPIASLRETILGAFRRLAELAQARYVLLVVHIFVA